MPSLPGVNRMLKTVAVFGLVGKAIAEPSWMATVLSYPTCLAEIADIPPGPPDAMLANYRKFAGTKNLSHAEGALFLHAGGDVTDDGIKKLLLVADPVAAHDILNMAGWCGAYAEEPARAMQLRKSYEQHA